ncbi:GerAB/ArcD/ProY family transporter [Brevibacillus thermoruber]|uniref:GerAB/ArcD/ProY family transporter n=1 Tax=Brevibacillus thermoruber TaxID=33942 RepID=UPI00054D54A0|nr:endospore germination permease [Brevibacillus thermoruber]
MQGLEQRPAISPTQLVMFEFGVFVGVGFLIMPRGAMEKAREDAWLTVILAGLCAIASLWVINRVARTFPHETVFDYNPKLFGTIIGSLLNVAWGLYYLFFTVTGIRVMAEVVREEMLPFTPVEVIIAAMLLVLVYPAWNGLMPIIRMFESGLPVTLLLMVMFFLLAYLRADWTELRIPFQDGIRPVISALPQTIYSFLGYEVLFLYYPFVTRKEKAFASTSIAIAAGGMFYAFLVLGTLVTLGPDVTITQTFPVVTMAKTIELVRQFVERAELLLIILWLPLAYTTHLGFFFSSAFSFHRTFPRLALRWWMVLLLPLVFVLSLIPDNLIAMQKWSDKVGLVGLFFTVPYPLIMLVCIVVRRKLGHLSSPRKDGDVT